VCSLHNSVGSGIAQPARKNRWKVLSVERGPANAQRIAIETLCYRQGLFSILKGHHHEGSINRFQRLYNIWFVLVKMNWHFWQSVSPWDVQYSGYNGHTVGVLYRTAAWRCWSFMGTSSVVLDLLTVCCIRPTDGIGFIVVRFTAALYNTPAVLSWGRRIVSYGRNDKIGSRYWFQSWLDGVITMVW
jgi:hypothetical protein